MAIQMFLCHLLNYHHVSGAHSGPIKLPGVGQVPVLILPVFSTSPRLHPLGLRITTLTPKVSVTWQILTPGLTAVVTDDVPIPQNAFLPVFTTRLLRAAVRHEVWGTAWNEVSSKTSCPLHSQPQRHVSQPTGRRFAFLSVSPSQWTTSSKLFSWGLPPVPMVSNVSPQAWGFRPGSFCSLKA